MTVGSARASVVTEALIFAEKIYVACNIESERNLRVGQERWEPVAMVEEYADVSG